MIVKILNPNEVNSATNDADLIFVDIRNYGGLYVLKNAYGAKNFVLPVDYLGLFITQPNLVPSFTLTLPTLAAEPIKQATPIAPQPTADASTNRPPV